MDIASIVLYAFYSWYAIVFDLSKRNDSHNYKINFDTKPPR